jgi:hypothetical protein
VIRPHRTVTTAFVMALFVIGISAAGAGATNRVARERSSSFVLHGIHTGASDLAPLARQQCSFFFRSVLHPNDLSVEFRSTRIDLLTCTMRGVKTVTPRFTPFYIPGCPCRSNVKNRVYVQDIASLVLHEVWAQIAWDWNGVSVWNFSCLGGKKVDAITGQWYLANAGAQYCPERPDSVSVRDRMDNQVFKYPAGGFFCGLGAKVTYRNVYVTGGKTGGVTTGQIVNIDEPVICPPLSVHAATIRVSG